MNEWHEFFKHLIEAIGAIRLFVLFVLTIDLVAPTIVAQTSILLETVFGVNYILFWFPRWVLLPFLVPTLSVGTRILGDADGIKAR